MAEASGTGKKRRVWLIVLLIVLALTVVGLLIYFLGKGAKKSNQSFNPNYNPANPNSNPYYNPATQNQSWVSTAISSGANILDKWLKGDYKNPFGSGSDTPEAECLPFDCCGNPLTAQSPCVPLDPNEVCDITDC